MKKEFILNFYNNMKWYNDYPGLLYIHVDTDNSIPQAGFQYAMLYGAVISCCIMVWFYISGILLTQVVCLPSKNTSQGKLIESLAKVYRIWFNLAQEPRFVGMVHVI